jgi:hypothetical protein
MGYLLIEKSYIKGSTPNNIRLTDTNPDKIIDLDLTTGIGIAIPIKGKFAVSVEARNNIGFLNIAKSSTSNDKTFSANLLIGFAYKFGKK